MVGLVQNRHQEIAGLGVAAHQHVGPAGVDHLDGKAHRAGAVGHRLDIVFAVLAPDLFQNGTDLLIVADEDGLDPALALGLEQAGQDILRIRARNGDAHRMVEASGLVDDGLKLFCVLAHTSPPMSDRLVPPCRDRYCFSHRNIVSQCTVCARGFSVLFLFSSKYAASGVAVKFAHGSGELAQQLFLRACQVFRDLHRNGYKLVAASGAAQIGDALAAQAEDRAGLRPLGDGELDLAVERGDLHLGAEGGLRVADLLLEQDGGAVALETGVRAHDDGHQQIACRAAVGPRVAAAGLGDGLPVVDAGGDVDLHLVLTADAAHAPAGLAGLVDDFAGAAALGAGGARLHHAEGRALVDRDMARALAVRADLRRRAGGAARALAVRAALDAADRDLLLAAEGGLLEADVQRGAQVVALARRVRVGARRAAEAAEDVAEDVAEAPEAAKASEAVKPAEAARARVGIEGGEAELVVLLALFLVREDLVGLVGLLEALLAGLVAGVQIGVVFLGQLSVCFFDFIRCGVLFDAQHLIIVSFFGHEGLLIYMLSGGVYAPPETGFHLLVLGITCCRRPQRCSRRRSNPDRPGRRAGDRPPGWDRSPRPARRPAPDTASRRSCRRPGSAPRSRP